MLDKSAPREIEKLITQYGYTFNGECWEREGTTITVDSYGIAHVLHGLVSRRCIASLREDFMYVSRLGFTDVRCAREVLEDMEERRRQEQEAMGALMKQLREYMEKCEVPIAQQRLSSTRRRIFLKGPNVFGPEKTAAIPLFDVVYRADGGLMFESIDAPTLVREGMIQIISESPCISVLTDGEDVARNVEEWAATFESGVEEMPENPVGNVNFPHNRTHVFNHVLNALPLMLKNGVLSAVWERSEVVTALKNGLSTAALFFESSPVQTLNAYSIQFRRG